MKILLIIKYFSECVYCFNTASIFFGLKLFCARQYIFLNTSVVKSSFNKILFLLNLIMDQMQCEFQLNN
jgi:hypothetical protein